ncbi:MAG: ABC transporter permease [Pasteurella sp.]|nr:ABC transporter permease [Pasteurella sp.]
MPINFLQLLQDSWNFIHNQRQFSIFAVVTMLFIQVLDFVLLSIFPVPILTQTSSPEKVLVTALPTFILFLLNLLFTALVILNIKSINNGNSHHFFQPILRLLKSLFSLILINLISVIPLSLAIVLLTLGMWHPTINLTSLPFIAIGFYFFIKLFLAVYVYLIEEPQKSVTETLVFTFKLSKGKMRPLVLFCLLSFIPLLIINSLEKLGDSIPVMALSSIVSTLLGVFLIVFSFRFYQLYRKL